MAGPCDEKELHSELLSLHAQRQQIIGFRWEKEAGRDSPCHGLAISLEPVDFWNHGGAGKAAQDREGNMHRMFWNILDSSELAPWIQSDLSRLDSSLCH